MIDAKQQAEPKGIAERGANPVWPAPGEQAKPPKPPAPRSDIGTIVLHWTLTVSILVSLATGLRLSADAPDSWFAAALSPILPQGEIWTPHFISALVALGCMVAYTVYMGAGQLLRRTSLRKAVVLTLPAAPKLRWGAVNVLLHWVLFASVIVLSATGVLLYLGHGGWVVTVHYLFALLVIAYIAAHLVGHFMFGGVRQWLRLFRPQRLKTRPGAVKRPLAIASVAGAVVIAGFYGLDTGTTDELVMERTARPPTIDGHLDDPVWRDARPVTVRTHQGVNLGGTGESTVEIRAAYDRDRAYFAFRWEDPSRSLKRHALIKRSDGWHLLHDGGGFIADENAFYEDKFAITFSRAGGWGSGDSTHMGPRPLPGKPGAINNRGLHYTRDGSVMDLWQWKAARGGMLGVVDDMWFGPPLEANEAQRAGKARYSAGYEADSGSKFYVYNYGAAPPGGVGPVEVKRLPKDWQRTVAKLGRVSLEPGVDDDPGSQWWMFEHETVPYDPEVDAGIPVGTVIPAVLIEGEYAGSRADVAGAATWADGHWTLEVTRAIDTGDADKDLVLTDGLYLWVAVFDRNQTRHTRHVRPVILRMR